MSIILSHSFGATQYNTYGLIEHLQTKTSRTSKDSLYPAAVNSSNTVNDVPTYAVQNDGDDS